MQEATKEYIGMKLVLSFLAYFSFAVYGFAIEKSHGKFDLNNFLFQIGANNGKPALAEEGLNREEFKILESMIPTVKIRKKGDFPQRIQPGQRFALFFDQELPLKESFIINFSISHKKESEHTSSPIIEVKYNSHVLFRQRIVENNHLTKDLKIFIPWRYNEKGRNVLEIKNLGMEIAAFDFFEIKPFSPFQEKTSDFREEVPKSIRSLAQDVANFAEKNQVLWEKSPRFLIHQILEYLNKRNTPIFPITKFAELKDFYDPFTGKPILAYHALKKIKYFFEGANIKGNHYFQKKIVCNIFPGSDKTSLSSNAIISATRNNENSITVGFLPSASDISQKMKIILPIPWEGQTDVKILTGILPEGYRLNTPWLKPQNKKEFETNIFGNLFSEHFTPNGFTIIRLNKRSRESSLASISLPAKPKNWKIPVFKSKIIKLSLSRPNPISLRKEYVKIHKDSRPLECISGCFNTSIIPATKGTIGKIDNVSPWDSESYEIKYNFAEENQYNEPWVKLNISPLGKDGYLSFWVFPKSSNKKIKKVSFPLYFKDKKEDEFCFASRKLNTNQWQRVVLPGINTKNDFIRLLGNSKLPEFRGGETVTFEINGLANISYEKNPDVKSVRIISMPEIENKSNEIYEGKLFSKTLVMLGERNKYFEYRYPFSETVDFKKVSALSKIKDIELIWRKDAQVLEVKGKFPEKDYQISEKLLSQLTNKEQKAIKEGKLTPIGIKLLYEQ